MSGSPASRPPSSMSRSTSTAVASSASRTAIRAVTSAVPSPWSSWPETVTTPRPPPASRSGAATIAVYGAVELPSWSANEPPKRPPRERPSTRPPGRHSATLSTSVRASRAWPGGPGTVKERWTLMALRSFPRPLGLLLSEHDPLGRGRGPAHHVGHLVGRLAPSAEDVPGHDLRVGGVRPAHADAHAREVGGAEARAQRLEAVV